MRAGRPRCSASGSDDRVLDSLWFGRVIPPEPAELVGKDRRPVLLRVAAVAEHVLVVVVLFSECRDHRLVLEEPVALGAIGVAQVVDTILDEDADRLLLALQNLLRINVPAA